MTTVTILGCGWLGLPLAEHLQKAGYKVKGSIRSGTDLAKLESRGIKSYLVNLAPEIQGADLNSFFDSDVLIINFPPERRSDIVEYHERQAQSLIHKIQTSPIKNVIFVSSTSVYPDLNREVTEKEKGPPVKDSGKALLKFESLLADCHEFQTTIVRFAGLIGYDRKPGRFLSGKKDIINADAPVNLIHRDDCINILHQIIEKNLWGNIYNACSDIHPRRRDYYIKAAKALGLPAPEFTESKSLRYKIVNSDKIKKDLEYTFIHPDPSEILSE